MLGNQQSVHQKQIVQFKNCSRIFDDIDTIMEAVMERDMTNDQIVNLLIGLKELYSIHFTNLSDSINLELHNGQS